MAKRRRSSRKSSKTSDAIAGCLVLVSAVEQQIQRMILKQASASAPTATSPP